MKKKHDLPDSVIEWQLLISSPLLIGKCLKLMMIKTETTSVCLPSFPQGRSETQSSSWTMLFPLLHPWSYKISCTSCKIFSCSSMEHYISSIDFELLAKGLGSSLWYPDITYKTYWSCVICAHFFKYCIVQNSVREPLWRPFTKDTLSLLST